MRQALPLSLLTAASLVLNSCASIVSHTTWPVAISSMPQDADVVVTDLKGKEVARGKTPTAFQLRSGAGYFQKAVYTITFTKAGYDTKQLTLSSDINGWYFGNLVFGGVIGLLIVDPISGAMYRINQKDLQATLAETGKTSIAPLPGELKIMSVDEVPAELRSSMLPIQ
jgi:hypothetical protein